MRFTDLTMPSFEGAKDLVLREKCALEALLENHGKPGAARVSR